jgi:uncharacterized protein YlxW (UPF0749 family)
VGGARRTTTRARRARRARDPTRARSVDAGRICPARLTRLADHRAASGDRAGRTMSSLASRVRRVPGWQWTFAVALLALGFLVVVQLGAEGPRVRYSSSERPPLLETARELDATQAALQARILELREQIASSEAASAGTDQAVMQLNDELTQARLAAGLVEIEGPGMIVRIDDSGQPVPPDAAAADYLVSANDLRDLVVELWQAGAQAISVNGERIVETTAFTDIGSSILVNSAYLQPPYDLSVIGPPELYDRLTASPGFVDLVRSRVQDYGLELGFLPSDKVVVAAFAGTVKLLQGRALPSPSPGGDVGPGGPGAQAAP